MARKHSPRDSSAGPSQRQLRVAEEIRHVLARLLAKGDLRDPALIDVSVTISEVRISPDLKNATVFATPLTGSQKESVLKGLNRSAPYLRSQIGGALALRYAPNLTFVEDKSFDEALHIEELLKSERVARDLEAQKEIEDDEETR